MMGNEQPTAAAEGKRCSSRTAGCRAENLWVTQVHHQQILLLPLCEQRGWELNYNTSPFWCPLFLGIDDPFSFHALRCIVVVVNSLKKSFLGGPPQQSQSSCCGTAQLCHRCSSAWTFQTSYWFQYAYIFFSPSCIHVEQRQWIQKFFCGFLWNELKPFIEKAQGSPSSFISQSTFRSVIVITLSLFLTKLGSRKVSCGFEQHCQLSTSSQQQQRNGWTETTIM